ncbi:MULTISPECIES: hypothetical protein [Bosea]|uniref:hypothetical protein n=1 Tax=Bosea TaxID=85413 RepID=UPI0021500E9E|nr:MULTISPECIES: hypothetical protein [Bosea]MCR4523758.1 hypothetical protein [Bosea sp. 47.2.35]MDR6830033.1 hypothetical protein [Bosea robiniae]MDR6897006.1 hypothetical protein [Bosea sp. BE109]MDR7140313.1 hypothetical protein [Bosea sp. BE168]MDR7177100.1 hypothetical protein [Bosea sp. BE271]
MRGFLIPAGLAAAMIAAAGGPASAFWQRSQVSACSDATTDAERQRLRCWELKAYADPGWPALGAGGGAYLMPAPAARHGRGYKGGGVTRRLG